MDHSVDKRDGEESYSYEVLPCHYILGVPAASGSICMYFCGRMDIQHLCLQSQVLSSKLAYWCHVLSTFWSCSVTE